MSYLDMINFEESTLLEGEQAEAYKAKKAKEKSDKEAAERKQSSTRYDGDKEKFGKKYTRQNPEYQKDKQAALHGDEKAMDRMDDKMTDDSRRMSAAAHKANRDYASGKRPMNHDQNIRAIDATNRHMRHHPKQYKEAVELAESLLESYRPDCIYC